MDTTTLKELIEKHRIGRKYPDAIMIDKEEKDHKIIFWKEPTKLDEHALHDKKREKGKYYMKEMKS
jgi:hypothetical protein